MTVGDWAILEVESIDWLPVWGITKKPLYQMESMRRIEINYGLSMEELEYMRMGRFVQMHRSGNFIYFDDFCKKQNYALKQCMNNPDINMMINKLWHLHAASCCTKMVFGYVGRTASYGTTVKDDVRALYFFSLPADGSI